MKRISSYITEKLKIAKNQKVDHTLFPKNKVELNEMITAEINKNGYGCDLNLIDVSKITDMSYLFFRVPFIGDISEWDVSNVENMMHLFHNSKFNGDISGWDVSSAIDMSNMFQDSKFNQNISNWKINQHCKIKHMFADCDINQKYIPKSLM